EQRARLAVAAIERPGVPQPRRPPPALVIELVRDEHRRLRAEPESREPLAHRAHAADQVVGANEQSGIELAQAEQPERTLARTHRGAVAAGKCADVHDDPAVVPIAHALLDVAPGGDVAR